MESAVTQESSESCTSTVHRPFPTSGWKQIEDCKDSVVEFDLTSLMHYFVARKAGGGLHTDNFRCISSDSLKLYKKTYCREQQVAFALADGGTNKFIRCFCKAEMKVTERYKIEMIVKSSTSVGEVVYATCQCKAGLGPKATCKHVGAVWNAHPSKRRVSEMDFPDFGMYMYLRRGPLLSTRSAPYNTTGGGGGGGGEFNAWRRMSYFFFFFCR